MSGPTLTRTPQKQAEWKKIPEAMRALWRACMPEDGGDVARSLTINFIGIAPASDAAALNEAVDRLQRRTPCRAFLLLIDDSGTVGSGTVGTVGNADLAATTRSHGSVRDIVLEEIVIRLPEAALGQMPGLVRPLLMNDLPNHLYWATRWPQKQTHFDALAHLCDHVVIDSRRFADPARDLRTVQERRARGQRLTDLSWLRLRPHRRALAEAFERVAWTPGMPTSGCVRHGRVSGAAAHLLADWLGSRLACRLELDPSGDATSPCPDSVVLRTGGFEIELLTQHPQIRVHVTTPAHCYLPFAIPMSRGTDGDLLGAAIDMG